jgi:N6-L-threonylcarbamoyladenine synthase
MCASFQASVLDVLIEKTKNAAEIYGVKQIILAGGVASNQGLRTRIYQEIPNYEIIVPSLKYCTDNAAMIGAAAYFQFLKEGASKDYLISGYSTIHFESHI